MHPAGQAWRQFFKRHAEAIFIVSFILADCFLSGWALTIGTLLGVLYVVLPAARTLPSLDKAAQLTFLKAFVKTAKVQRLAILLFWVYSVRLILYSANESALLCMNKDPGLGGTVEASLSNSFVLGAQQWAPLAFLATPLVIYFGACLTAIFLRSRLKASKQDPDLISQRQRWSGASHILLLSAFVASILSITLNVKGPAYMVSNWILASSRDANIFCETCENKACKHPDKFDVGGKPQVHAAILESYDPPSPSFDGALPPLLQGVTRDHATLDFVEHFDIFILSSSSLAAFLLLLQPIQKLHAFLTSFCWRVVSPKSIQNVIEGFLEALRLPVRTLTFRKAHPFLSNACRSLAWLVLCYAGLFWLFGFCGGPLGEAIHNWMMASVVDAGFADGFAAPNWLFDPRLRIFLGSIVALYGTAPIAVTAAVILPYAKPRKIVINNDGILFAQGPFISLWLRQFRLWSDLKSLTVKTKSPANGKLRAKFTLSFRSGGHISFNNSQINSQDFKVLMEGIDQHAVSCTVAPEVFSVCRTLADQYDNEAASDGLTDTSITITAAQEFKSTIFIPFAAGELIPESQIRIIKQLSSKPLCAVYLARNEDGRLVTVKQFYLPEENEETRALAKILRREYELLTKIDHPGIAKVLNSFTVEQSTYLVIEHRVGVDLRETVQEHGPRSEGLCIFWARQICEIMIYLHEQEPAILHRDLTPDNVIAGEDGQLRLIDFGAAREFLDGITGTMIGKHCYVSPEQLRGEANLRSDIYSFGATMYFLLTGRDPLALSQSSPAKNIDCSDELDSLIKDCTEFEAENRPQSFKEVLDRLNNLDRGVRLNLHASKKEKVFV